MPALPPENTLHAQAYDRIKEALMTGVYRPGQKVTIRALAAALGVSATPIREALRRLVGDGALEILPNRTVRVPVLTRTRLEEITSIRIRLEGLAAARAAERMSDAEVAALDKLQLEMAAARDRRDFQTYMAANESFHFTVYRAAGLPSLLRLIEAMWLQCGPFMNVLRPTMRGIDLHSEAIRAIQAHDAELAQAAIEQDITRGYQHIDQLLSEQECTDGSDPA
jgi:DNA-binding GntR family transcriptional regulator